MDKQLIRQLLKESINQNYNFVYNVINEKLDELEDTTAAKILIDCCRVFYEKDKDLWNDNNKANMDYLFQILFICNGRINEIDDNLLLGYFQSMYFLVVHLHEKKKYGKLLELNNLLMPKFMNGSEQEKVLKVYRSICNRIFNIIYEFNNSDQTDIILYHSFLTLLLGMRFLLYPTKVALVESTYILIKNKKFSDCDEHIQHNLFTFILELINKNKKNEYDKEHLEDVYCATLKILEVLIGVNLKQHNINKVQEIINVANSMTSKTCHTIVYQKLFGIILSVTELIVKLTTIGDCIEVVSKMFESCIEDFNDFCKKFGFLPNLQKTCNTISVLLYNWVEYFLTSKSSWTFLQNKQILKMLFKFVGGIGKVVSKVPITCTTCSHCKVQTDLNTCIQITSLIGNFWKLSVAETQEISISLCLSVVHYFENCCTNIKMLKDLNCQLWKSLWNQVGTSIYNVGVKLYTRKHRECSKFFILVIQIHNYLEGISNNSIFKFNIVNSSLMCLMEIYLQLKEYNSALTFAALGIFVRRNNLENVHREWVRAKSAARESTDNEILKYTELTVVECLQQNVAQIRTVYPDFNCDFEKSVIIKLLSSELENYKLFWQSKVPMKCAFLKLYEVADLITSIKALIKYWGFNASLINEDIFLLLPEMLDKLEHDNTLEKMEKQILLASLYIIQYYNETWKARNRMTDTINNTVIFEEPAPLPHEQPKNPNDEFDLVSSYVNLKIDVHGKIWDVLNKSLSIFQKCISETALPSTVEILKEYDIYKIILNIIYEFKIHCNSLKVISACFLGLQISKLLENNVFTLEMASLLLEENTVSSNMLKDNMLAECNAIEKKLCDSDDAMAVLTQYCIAKSLMHLREENVKLGYEEYQVACKYCNKLPGEKYEAIKLKVEFLHVKYLQLPCTFKIEGHDSHSLEKFSNVYNKTLINYKEIGCYSLFTTLLYMEVSLSVADFYKWMHLPREVRCYCRDIVTLVQSLVFPIRTAYFIIYLAQADLLSSRWSDCQNKLKELANILCLRNDKPMDLEHQSPIKKTKNVDNLIEGFRDINLNSHYNNRQLMGSPELPIKDFQFPAFMEHPDNCDCFYCVNVEYKCLILMYVNLVAQLNLSQGNLEVANNYFQNGLRIYDYMVNSKQLRAFEIKTTKQLSSYPFYKLQDILCPTYSTMLLHYGNFLLKSNNFTKAELINKSLMNLISKRKYSNMFLYNEARFQKMLLIMTETKLLEIPEPKFDTIDSNDNLEIVKTPENRKTKVLFKIGTPTVSSPPKRRLRKIKCDFSFEDDDDKPATPKHSKKRTVAKKETKINSALLCKTPAPMSTQNPYVATSIKRPILQKISPVNGSKCETFNNLDITSMVPMSPNAYTPNAIKAQTTMKKISKNGKTVAALSEVVKSKSKPSSQDINEGVCKNLMGELKEADDIKSKIKSTKKPPVIKRIKSKEQETRLPRPTRSCKRL